MRTALCSLLLVLAACAHRPASSTSVPVESIPANPEDVSTVEGVMKAFYEVINLPAGAPRQWARDRTLYSPWIRFVAIGKTVQVYDHQSFVEATDPLFATGFQEPELRRIVRRYGNIAHVESSYEARPGPGGGPVSRGVNYVQLYFDGTRWWITSVVWQSEDAEHPLPPELLPASQP